MQCLSIITLEGVLKNEVVDFTYLQTGIAVAFGDYGQKSSQKRRNHAHFMTDASVILLGSFLLSGSIPNPTS